MGKEKVYHFESKSKAESGISGSNSGFNLKHNSFQFSQYSIGVEAP